MPAITPGNFVVEESPATGSPEPDRTLWISEAGKLTQFGAFIEVLQPGSRSSIKHWHSAEDEMIYVLEGEITVVEGTAETLLRRGHAATFKAGTPVGHYLHNRSNAATRCLVVGLARRSIGSRIRSTIACVSGTDRCRMTSGRTWPAIRQTVRVVDRPAAITSGHAKCTEHCLPHQ
jgi:uncharacterized cupin superfamily protein